MNEKKLIRLIDIADETLIEFLSDDSFLFSEAPRLNAFRYSNARKRRQRWGKTRTCIFPGCDKNSIKHSHSVPKSSALSLIASSGHVLAPKFSYKSLRVEMELTSINKATTFPGFCHKHEKVFRDFEETGEITEISHFTKQLYRMVCKEVVRHQIELEDLEATQQSYLAFRNGILKAELEKRLGTVDCSNTQFDIPDPREISIRNRIASEKRYLKEIGSGFLTAAQKDLFGGANHSLYAIIIKTEAFIPLCLSGQGNFVVFEQGRMKNISILLSVIPQKNCTLVIIACPVKNKNNITSYVESMARHIGVLGMIESWMVHGTDHWFIQRDVWQSISYEFRRKILDDIFDVSKNISNTYPFTIFNSLKRGSNMSVQVCLDFQNHGDVLFKLFEQENIKFTDES